MKGPPRLSLVLGRVSGSRVCSFSLFSQPNGGQTSRRKEQSFRRTFSARPADLHDSISSFVVHTVSSSPLAVGHPAGQKQPALFYFCLCIGPAPPNRLQTVCGNSRELAQLDSAQRSEKHSWRSNKNKLVSQLARRPQLRPMRHAHCDRKSVNWPPK